jgi:Tol biopolymer transport system component
MSGIRLTSVGPYQIEHLLGSGGMGEVYRARDVRLGRPVAIKILRPDRTAAADRARLLREARAASALNHPHIVTVYDAGSADGIDYIAMELVAGETLSDVLARGPLEPARAVAYAAQLADAVARAHEHGIVHRDLKPANVMIASGDRVKVLDFGIAKLLGGPGEDTATALTGEAIIGTSAYMSPEQVEGRTVDARSDVFSFGCVLYEMLTGDSPFERDTGVGTLAAILHAEPASLGDTHPHLGDELLRIVSRCLRKDPARRFQSMADVHLALEDLAASLAPPSPRAGRRTRRVGALALAGVILAAAAGAAWVLPRWFGTESSDGVAFVVSRLTFEPGLQTQPVWSPDGRFVAYSADRDDNFDIYVRQVDGGTPVRVTTAAGIDWQPDWSPDGSRLVYRTEHDRGGLFVVPAFGGASRRISAFGFRPRWSPDGRRVMFVTSAMAITEVPDVYVVDSEGGDAPRRVLRRAFEGFRSVWSVQWHPTRDVVTFLGRTGDRGWDLWTASFDSARAARFTVPESVKERIVTVASAVFAPDGSSVYFEGTSPSGVTNLYAARASIDRLADFGTPQMLTSGLQDSEIAISRDGRRLAYTRRQERNRVWRLPLDPRDARAGDGEPLTAEGMHALHSDVTPDGSTLAFIAFRDGQSRQELWESSLVNGQARPVLVDDFRRIALRWSRDGRRLAYRRSSYDATRTRGQHEMMIYHRDRGEEQPLTSSAADTFDIPFDWTRDGGWILGGTNRPTGYSAIARYPVAAAPAAERGLEVVVQVEDSDLWQARYSPDERFIAFTRVPRSGIGESVLHVVPAAGGPLVAITESRRWADKPRWSADGSWLYYLSNRTAGTFNVWGQRIDPARGQPVGDPVALTRFHGPRVMISPLLASVELSVAPGALILPLHELSGNIWLLTRTE